MPGTRAARSILAAVLLLAAVAVPAAADSIRRPDTLGNVGRETSLELDAAGHPVVSYYDATNQDLKVLHCNDRACAGGGDSITAPNTLGDVGRFSSLQLDAAGNPVISYHRVDAGGQLKILHCNDPDCAGSDDVAQVPDDVLNAGFYTSLQLDANGYPVVAYHENSGGDLMLLHCNDPACAGGDDSTELVDQAGDVGAQPSLQLDPDGNPVIAYFDHTNQSLKVAHCDDPDCDFSAGDSRRTVDHTGNSADPSLQLNPAGNPIIAYVDFDTFDLKVMRCDDAACDPGTSGDTIASPDIDGGVGSDASMQLDASGNPVVAYRHGGTLDLHVLHCDDPTCAGGGEVITVPVIDGNYHDMSLQLDGDGYPVVSFHDGLDAFDLGLLACDDPNCVSGLDPLADAGGPYAVPEGGSVVLHGSGSDPDGGSVTLAWDLYGDDGFNDATGPTPTFDAASHPPGEYTVGLLVADDDTPPAGRVSTTTVTVLDVPDQPPPDPEPTDPDPVDQPASATRAQGPDRIATAIAVSQERFGPDDAGAVVLARADAFPDALASAPLAARDRAPILLTDPSGLRDDVLGEIQRVLPAGGRVWIAGGPTALSAAIDTQLVDAGLDPDRLAGPDRYATAVAIADELESTGDADHVLLATGTNFPDAVALAPAAASVDGVILLTRGDQAVETTTNWLAGHAALPVTAAGNPAASAYPDADGLAGATRIETALLVADAFFPAPRTVGLARADAFPDALVAQGLLVPVDGPLLLTDSSRLPAAVAAWLSDHRPDEIVVFGGTAVLTDEVVAAAVAAADG